MQSSFSPPHSIKPKLHLIPVMFLVSAHLKEQFRVCGGWHDVCLATCHISLRHTQMWAVMMYHSEWTSFRPLSTCREMRPHTFCAHVNYLFLSWTLFSGSAKDCLNLDSKTSPQVAGIVGVCQTQCFALPVCFEVNCIYFIRILEFIPHIWLY